MWWESGRASVFILERAARGDPSEQHILQTGRLKGSGRQGQVFQAQYRQNQQVSLLAATSRRQCLAGCPEQCLGPSTQIAQIFFKPQRRLVGTKILIVD